MKILVDMNLSPLWIPFLKQLGFGTVHWSDVGAASASDTAIMGHASARGFVIFTQDLDFGTLLAMRRTATPSLIQIRSHDVLPSAIGDLVVNALNAARSHLASGALVSVPGVEERLTNSFSEDAFAVNMNPAPELDPSTAPSLTPQIR